MISLSFHQQDSVYNMLIMSQVGAGNDLMISRSFHQQDSMNDMHTISYVEVEKSSMISLSFHQQESVYNMLIMPQVEAGKGSMISLSFHQQDKNGRDVLLGYIAGNLSQKSHQYSIFQIAAQFTAETKEIACRKGVTGKL